MMNQHEIASPVELLDQQGHLLHPGYATRMQWQYDPRKIKARPFALKEWDFFQVQLGGWVLQFTLGHVSYAWNAAVTLLHPADGRHAGDGAVTGVLMASNDRLSQLKGITWRL